MKLTRNQAFMAKHAGVKVPFMPVHGESELKLFTQLIASSTDAKPDFEQMALDWVKKVDGVDVFPKLPVYLRTYYATWTRNQAAKNAMEQAKPATALLQQVIEKTRHKQSEEQEQGGSGQPAPAAPKQYETMPQPKVVVVEPEEPRIVGGVGISVPPSTEEGEPVPELRLPPAPMQKKIGQRGKDKVGQRATRRCTRCIKFSEAAEGDGTVLPKCKGAAKADKCQHWTAEGKSKKPKKK
jgi:hypothetical protein